MGVIIPPGYAEVNYRHTLTGDPEEMLVTFGHIWDPSGTDQQLINDLFDAWFAQMKVGVTAGLTFVGATAYIGQDGADALVVQSTTTGGVGTTSGTSAPSNTAGLVRKNTAFAGRKGKGRFYMPGITMNGISVNGAFVTTGLQTACNGWMGVVATGALSSQAAPVVLHGPSVIESPFPVLSLSVQNKVATQRRRLRP